MDDKYNDVFDYYRATLINITYYYNRAKKHDDKLPVYILHYFICTFCFKIKLLCSQLLQ